MNALFVNTRPSHKADFKLPIPSVRLPLLDIHHFKTVSKQERLWLMQFIQGDIQTVVAVSTEAVKGALDFLGQQGIHHASALPHRPTMIAVGKPTADALQDFGFDVITPSNQALAMSNEGMIQMDELSHLGAGDTLMIWRGTGGRRLLHDTLASQGVSVKAVAFYERRLPRQLSDDIKRLFASTPTDTRLFVLISSATSLKGWTAYDTRTHQTTFLTLGDRLTKLTQVHYPDGDVYELDTLDETQILSVIADVMG